MLQAWWLRLFAPVFRDERRREGTVGWRDLFGIKDLKYGVFGKESYKRRQKWAWRMAFPCCFASNIARLERYMAISNLQPLHGMITLHACRHPLLEVGAETI